MITSTINLTKTNNKQNEAKQDSKVNNTRIPYYRYDTDSLNSSQLLKDQIRHFKLLNTLTDMSMSNDGYMNEEIMNGMIDSNYAFMASVVNDKPYKKDGYSLVVISLNYCSSKPVSLYMRNEKLVELEVLSNDMSMYKPY